MASSPKGNIFEKLVPALLVVSVVLAFFVGVLWQKVNSLESGGTKVVADKEVSPEKQGPQAPTTGKLNEDEANKLPPVTEKDHVKGARNAKVLLVEYSDLECPFCKNFHPTLQKVLSEYDGQVAWVYRHFPLDLLHSKARTEAQAAECAAELGGNDGFWKFIDEIYAVTPANNGLDLAELPKIANKVGKNGTKLQTCVDEEKFADLVEEQYQGGITAGIQGTPGTFIVNQKGEVWSVPGAIPFESVKQMIDEALKS